MRIGRLLLVLLLLCSPILSAESVTLSQSTDVWTALDKELTILSTQWNTLNLQLNQWEKLSNQHTEELTILTTELTTLKKSSQMLSTQIVTLETQNQMLDQQLKILETQSVELEQSLTRQNTTMTILKVVVGVLSAGLIVTLIVS